MSARVRRSTGRSGWPEAPLTVALVLAMAPLVPPTVVLVLPTVVLPTVVLVMLALLTVALSPEYVPADTRARRSEQERQQEQELKTKTQ